MWEEGRKWGERGGRPGQNQLAPMVKKEKKKKKKGHGGGEEGRSLTTTPECK